MINEKSANEMRPVERKSKNLKAFATFLNF